MKSIYNFLMEDLLMSEAQGDGGQQQLTPLRVELNDMTVNWPRSWQLARAQPLGPQLNSFLFKLLHQLLPTGERVAKILPSSSPLCSQCIHKEVETLHHALFACAANLGLSYLLLQALKEFDPLITPHKVLTLNFELNSELQLPITWSIATFLSSLWSARADTKKVSIYAVRSEVEAACRILRESKFKNASHTVDQVISSIFS